ncbi:uncharacterized protein [Macaca fascicularis]|uniref:uncharacterized protein n=1 Tax=Macaca fascicularis TaxID=9541 RepID=UPI003D15B8AD
MGLRVDPGKGGAGPWAPPRPGSSRRFSIAGTAETPGISEPQLPPAARLSRQWGAQRSGGPPRIRSEAGGPEAEDRRPRGTPVPAPTGSRGSSGSLFKAETATGGAQNTPPPSVPGYAGPVCLGAETRPVLPRLSCSLQGPGQGLVKPAHLLWRKAGCSPGLHCDTRRQRQPDQLLVSSGTPQVIRLAMTGTAEPEIPSTPLPQEAPLPLPDEERDSPSTASFLSSSHIFQVNG